MKKRGLLIIAVSMIFFASCDYRTCPTYTKKPANFEKLQKMDQEKQTQINVDAKRV